MRIPTQERGGQNPQDDSRKKPRNNRATDVENNQAGFSRMEEF